jgi:branched-chain amino acid transport system substrate-binding protein
MRPTRLVILLYFTLVFGFLLSVMSSGALAQDAACSPADGEAVVLGAVFPGAAVFSVRTAQAYEGVQAMIRAINACGGLNGQPVELRFQSARNREEAISAAQSLIDAGVPLIIGSGSLAVSEGVAEAAEAGEVIFWEVSEAVDQSAEWTFSPRASNRQLGQIAAEFAQTRVADALELDGLQTALIYESRPRGQFVAEGLNMGLDASPLIRQSYSDFLDNAYSLAVAIREEEVNLVTLVAFDYDADWLWWALREADANIAAWIHVGSEGYKRELCQRYGNTEALISVTAAGAMSQRYQEAALGEIFTTYRSEYVSSFATLPDDTASIAAAGTYMLLRHVLNAVEGDLTPDTIRSAILSAEAPRGSGLMGEGLRFDPDSGENQYASAVIQQRQFGSFCTLWPEHGATCQEEVVHFPTWRQRALAEEQAVCSDPA